MNEPDTVAISLAKDKYGKWTVTRLYLVGDVVVDSVAVTADRAFGAALRTAREALEDVQTEISRGHLTLEPTQARKVYEDV